MSMRKALSAFVLVTLPGALAAEDSPTPATAKAVFEKGIELQKQGRYGDAISTLRQASALPAPDELAAEIRVELAETYFRRGQDASEGEIEGVDFADELRTAAALFREAVRRYPKVEKQTPYAAYMIGSCHLVLGEMEEALEAYKTAYFDYPDYEKRSRALVRIGVTLAALGEAEKARQIFDVFAKVYPDDDNLKKVRRYALQLQLVGRKAPPIAADEWLQGAVPGGLSDLRGEVVVVVFFATWCKQCSKELPHLKREIARWRDRGVVFLGVTNPDSPKTIEPPEFYVRKHRIDFFDVALDRKERSLEAYLVTGLPAAAVIDRNGIVRWRGHFAFMGHDLLEKLVQEEVAPRASR